MRRINVLLPVVASLMTAAAAVAPSGLSVKPCRHFAASLPHRNTIRSGQHRLRVNGYHLHIAAAGPSSFEELDEYLKSVGVSNRNERARLIDLNTNPNSLFAAKRRRGVRPRIVARPLSVEDDVKPVVDYLCEIGVNKENLPVMLTTQPAMIGYSVENHLKPLIEYLLEVGVEDIGGLLEKRPTLMGLSVDQSLRKIVDYLQSTDTPPEKIIEYLGTSI